MDTPTSPETPRRPSRSASHWLLALVVVALVVAGLLRVYFGPVGSQAALGGKLPLVALAPLSADAKADPAAEVAGKVAVVSYWATWCGPCRLELPQIGRVHREMADQADFVLVSILVDRESPNTVLPKALGLLREAGAAFPLYADPTGQAFGAFVDAGGQDGIPATVVLDRQGRIRGVWQGDHSDLDETLVATIKQLLAETP